MRRDERVLAELRDGKGLEAIAKRLALTLSDPECTPAEQASVARELRMVLKELRALPVADEGDPRDELAARRKARRRGA